MSNENGRDPYRGILDMVRQEAAGQIQSTFVIGKVLEATKTSIRIQADGHELDEQDILVNASLVPGTTFKFPDDFDMEGRLNGFASCGLGFHSFFQVNGMEGTATVGIPLKADDLVLLMPDGSRQFYYLICKVVRYGTVSAD